jgi:thiamine biosynthesis lipoprotein ApbE
VTVSIAVQAGVAEWSMWTTTVRVVTVDPAATAEACRVVANLLADVDAAANRFRTDSELSRLCTGDDGPQPVSDLLWSLLTAAIDGAVMTDGLVDPTVACTLNDLGYDRTITAVPTDSGRLLPLQVRRPVGWQSIGMDECTRTATLPRGCQLDLGATAKAWAADEGAAAAASTTGTGVLVGLGGDIAVSGAAPEEGWLVAVADDHARPGADAPQVVIRSGGLATSSTTTRRWRRSTHRLHHIIDPRTARPASDHWRTVSVAAGSCFDANVAATAAIIHGVTAVDWLTERRLPARLVASDRSVTAVAHWPGRA